MREIILILPEDAAAKVRSDGEAGLACLRQAIRAWPAARPQALNILTVLGPEACDALPEVLFCLVQFGINEIALDTLEAFGPCAHVATPILEAFLERNRNFPERIARLEAVIEAIALKD